MGGMGHDIAAISDARAVQPEEEHLRAALADELPRPNGVDHVRVKSQGSE